MALKILWVHNFGLKHKGSGSFIAESLKSGAGVSVLIEELRIEKLNSPFGVLRAFFLIRQKLSTGKYDILHAQFGSMCGLICAFFGIPKILTLRGSDWYKLKGGGLFRQLHSLMQSWFTRICLHRYSHVICVSNRMKDEVQALYPRVRATCIPSPIDLQKFQAKDKTAARERVNVAADAFVVLYPTLDRVNPIKRPELARQAFDLFSVSAPNAIFFYGQGFDHSEMPYVFSAADVVLMTSQYEGWPNSIKEGLACGVPFVSTDVSDLASAIQARMHSGLVVGSTPEEISGALNYVYLHPSNFSASEMRSIVEKMSSKKFEAQLFAVYSNISNETVGES